ARAVRGERELGAGNARARSRAAAARDEHLAEGRVPVQGLGAAEEAVIERRRVDLGLAPGTVELDVRDAAAEEIAAVRATRIDGVLGQDQNRRERRPAIGRLVQTDLSRTRRREAA